MLASGGVGRGIPAALSACATDGSGPAAGPATRPDRTHCDALPLAAAAAGGTCNLAASGDTSKWLTSAQLGTGAAPHARTTQAVAAAPAPHAPTAPAAPLRAHPGGAPLLGHGLLGAHVNSTAAGGALPCLRSGGALGAMPPLLPMLPPGCSPNSRRRQAAPGGPRGGPALRAVANGPAAVMLCGGPKVLRVPAAAGDARCTPPWTVGGAALAGTLGGLCASPVPHASSHLPTTPPPPPRAHKALCCVAAAGAAAKRGSGRPPGRIAVPGSACRAPDPAGLRGLLHELLWASVATRGSGLARPCARPGLPGDTGVRGVRGVACPCSIPRSLCAEQALAVPTAGPPPAVQGVPTPCSAAATTRASASASVAKSGWFLSCWLVCSVPEAAATQSGLSWGCGRGCCAKGAAAALRPGFRAKKKRAARRADSRERPTTGGAGHGRRRPLKSQSCLCSRSACTSKVLELFHGPGSGVVLAGAALVQCPRMAMTRVFG